jgi:hypothetical protein
LLVPCLLLPEETEIVLYLLIEVPQHLDAFLQGGAACDLLESVCDALHLDVLLFNLVLKLPYMLVVGLHGMFL